MSFLGSVLKPCIIFEIFLHFSFPPPYTQLKLGKNSGYTRPTLFVGWGEGDLCELENAPETQKCPKTFVHDWRLSGVKGRFDLAFRLLFGFLLHGVCGTLQSKIANKKFVTTSVKTTNARAEFESKNYCVTTEDVKLLKRNLCACLPEITSSFRLFKLARSGLQMINFFPTGTNCSDFKLD